jgi:hypothetical protein
MRNFFFLLFFFLLLSSKLLSQTCNTSNLATGKPITASLTEGMLVPGNIVDGDMSTEWYVGVSANQWLYVDLQAAYQECRVVLKWGAWHSHADFIIQGSSDATNWTNLYTNPSTDGGQLSTGSDYHFHDISLSSNTTSYRYVRVYLNNYQAYGGKLKEIEIYDKAAPSIPSVSITSPLTNAVYLEKNTVVINATASQTGGTISKVEFYDGGTLLGQSTTPPYRYVLTNLEARDYVLTAKAITAGGTTNTATITLKGQSLSNYWSLIGNQALKRDTHFIGSTDTSRLIFRTNNAKRMFITADGKVVIGGDSVKTMLTVGGEITAKKVTVTQQGWADYVFDSNYQLRSLTEVEQFILQNKHLPDVPSASEVEHNGLSVGDQHAVILRKVEELTLYVIAQQKEIEALKKKLSGRKRKGQK